MSRTILLSAAALLLALAPTAAGAKAKRPGLYFGSFYERTTIHKDPVHGYSGSGIASFPPSTFIHCDYQRLPVRACDASGRHCRAVAWKLYQYCY